MSNQGGLKHVATEPTPLESKRERRRGAAGRAAALRRAPSDSDCSGETASLSADSGDRVVRPAPPPTRSGKTRSSRRRGSEWEVLEGLKDGQRFEKRPEVFNGYLHKKRKWPLKGWHKRFFVIDGGILVYARSPTDVARGRLHGSVDVGLSVISAKARRRRIDIDADEFIYHLRAKTPDVLRTWLNVLKAHRLYRQHLLTFGARESVPKIHAPIDDSPLPDTSSRTSKSSTESSSSVNSSENQLNPIVCDQSVLSPSLTKQSSNVHEKYSQYNTDPTLIKGWCRKSEEKNNLLPLNLDSFSNIVLETNVNCYTLMKTSVRHVNDAEDKLSTQGHDSLIISESTDHEKQMLSTELNSLKSTEPRIGSLLLAKYSFNSSFNTSTKASKNPVHSNKPTNDGDALSISNSCKEKSLRFDCKCSPTPAFFFFTRKKESRRLGTSLMRSSRKSTNLVKYRNISKEPSLKKPLSKCILLEKCKLKVTEESDQYRRAQHQDKVCDRFKQNNEIQLKTTKTKHDKTSQVTITEPDYDKITEKLIVSIFAQRSNTDDINNDDTLKFYINEVVKELHDVKLNSKNLHPAKTLFRCLLEYWLKNNCLQNINDAERRMISVNTQSDKHLTKDQILSSVFISNISKATQFYGLSNYNNQTSKKSKKSSNKSKKGDESNIESDISTRNTVFSDDKEKRIQELERLLKSTVYMCETVHGSESKEKDIRITKTLIDNIGKISRKSIIHKSDENRYRGTSNSSSEIPKIQETINHLISETSIPPEIAKDFLSAYLDVLQHDSDKSNNTNSQSTETSKDSRLVDSKPACDVQTKPTQKQMSKSITILNNLSYENTIEKLEHDKYTKDDINLSIDPGDQEEKNPAIDPGQLYLKDMLDKITTIFTKMSKLDSKIWQKGVPSTDTKCQGTENEGNPKDELVKEYSEKNLIYENHEENSVVINLSKYDLEHISMTNKPTNRGIMAITIKLKEKLCNLKEAKDANLSLKFSNDLPKSLISKVIKCNSWLPHVNVTKSKSSHIFDSVKPCNLRNPGTDSNIHKDILKPYLSSSDDASKAYCRILRESEQSLGLSFQSSNFFRSDHQDSKKSFDGFDAQSCYMMSTIKKTGLSSKLQSKKVRLREINAPNARPQNTDCPSRSPIKSVQIKSAEVSLFDKRAPRIIDEKFIILLLENLTLLSKNVPGVHKDINNLYLKLKKKHEKVLKETHDYQGLGLLGKIYNEESSNNIIKSTNDAETQCDVCNYPKKQEPILIHAEIQYEAIVPIQATQLMKIAQAMQPIQVIQSVQAILPMQILIRKPCIDESLSAYRVPKKTYDCAIQTKSTTYTNKIMNTPDIEDEWTNLSSERNTSKTVLVTCVTQTSIHNKGSTGEVSSGANKSTSVLNSCMKVCNREHATSTMIKYRLHSYNDSKQNFRVIPQGPKIYNSEAPIPKRSNNERRQSSKVREDLINEISLLYPSFKASTHSQTDRKFTNVDADKESKKDFTVYQLFVSKKYGVTRSCSVTESTAKIKDRSDDLKTLYRCSSDPSISSESGGPLENASRELGQAQLSVQQLQRLLDALELQQQVHHDTDVSLEGASPNVKKDRRKFGLRKKKSNTKCASVELAPPQHIDPSSSHMALSALTAPPSPGGGASSVPNSAASLPIACAAARPQSLPGAEVLSASHTAAGPTSLTSLTPDHQLREDFTVLAKDLLASLKGIVATLVCERGRLRAAMEAADTTTPGGGAMMAALRTNLTSALQQNSELRSRLSRIHDASDLAEISSVGPNSDPVNRQFQQSLSYSSSCVSASEFFDAEEHEDDELKESEIIAADEAGVIELDGDSSSEVGSLSSEEGSASSDNSDGAMLSAEPVTLRVANGVESRPSSGWSRRTRLPCPRPTPGGPSLWNLLYKNIGKDLSQISMPVTINEPLNMLQRLCEELEYSELLDSASECSNAVERMALIAAFAVSAYASSAHRAASKPFNPLLAETYECVRDDRGFRFIAEQVSHHPPISACHAESSRWCFWQEARIKTKFWGKSMEFQPTGRVHVRLPTTGDHYSWNKVTTCVHNLFGGQRWVDQYGDMHITCHGTDISCKLNFIKASSWSSSRHEVRGAVTGGGTRLRLQGRWSEALYAGEPPAARCLWRPGTMPPEHEIYYGFTRFAMELNEMEPGMREALPHTDTRLRPDQRALEEGDVESAEQLKHELEQAQRERRRDYPDHAPAWFRKILEGGEETWVFTGEYWKAREAGFTPDAPSIW